MTRIAQVVFFPGFDPVLANDVIDPDFDGPPPLQAPLTHGELHGYAFGAGLLRHEPDRPSKTWGHAEGWVVLPRATP